MTALLAAREWTGLSKVFAQFPSPSKSNYLSRSNPLGNMEHRNLGGLLNVSVIGLGCLPMVGYYGGKYEKKDMIALIRHAYEKGVTFFDTAEVYGPYTSEEWVGEALAPFRDKVRIGHKVRFRSRGKATNRTEQPSRPYSSRSGRVAPAVAYRSY